MATVASKQLTLATVEKQLDNFAADKARGKDVDAASFRFVCEAAENGIYKVDSDKAPKVTGKKVARQDDAFRIVQAFSTNVKKHSVLGEALDPGTIAKKTSHFRAAIKLGENEKYSGSQFLEEVIDVRKKSVTGNVPVKTTEEALYAATVFANNAKERPTVKDIETVVRAADKTVAKKSALELLLSHVTALDKLYTGDAKKGPRDTYDGSDDRQKAVNRLKKLVETLAKEEKEKNAAKAAKAEKAKEAAARRSTPTKRGK